MRSAQIARSVTVEETRPEVGLPPVTAARRAFSANLPITQCDAFSRHGLMPTVGARCGVTGTRKLAARQA
jgi:hypothetical protein